MALSRTAKFYRDNPKARDKRDAYAKKYNAKPENKRKRSLLNKENRKRGTYGNGDGLDVSHLGNGKTKLEKASKNRANGTRTAGDRRSRGKKK